MICSSCKKNVDVGKDEYQFQIMKGEIRGVGLEIKISPLKIKQALIPVFLAICKECGLIQIFSKQIVEKKGEENGGQETTEGESGL